MRLYIGMDGGGTRTTAVAVREDGTLAGSAQGGGLNYLQDGLENQLDAAAEMVADGPERFGGADHHRGMRVVPAGMHDAGVARAVRFVLIVFLNGQGVHIGAEGQGEGGDFRVDGDHYGIASVPVRLIGDAGAVQFPADKRGRPVQIPAQFRIHMQFPTQRDQFFLRNRVIH